MKEALVETTTYDFEPVVNQTQSWVAKGEVIKFAGFMKLYVEGSDEESEEGENAELPALEKGDKVTTESLHALQSFSRPPARYTEAALVKKLESEGIGRPSTYAPTISTIIERGYVEKKEKRLHPTDIAFVVVDYLEANFKDLMDYQFTANIEQELDSIAQGKLGWVEMLTTFHKGFKEELKKTALTTEKVREKLGKKCPKCETGELVYKYSKGGKFI
jgi:DNA topoisomerase-1